MTGMLFWLGGRDKLGEEREKGRCYFLVPWSVGERTTVMTTSEATTDLTCGFAWIILGLSVNYCGFGFNSTTSTTDDRVDIYPRHHVDRVDSTSYIHR
jgi:hypothetical protein